MTDTTPIHCDQILDRSKFSVKVMELKDKYRFFFPTAINEDEKTFYSFMIINNIKQDDRLKVNESTIYHCQCFDVCMYRKSKQIWHICCHRKEHNHDDPTECESH